MCLVSYSKVKDYDSLKKIKNFTGTPTWAYVAITDNCNHNCPWCYNKHDNPKKDMSITDFKKILKKFKKIGIYQITLTGGEPLLHPQLKNFIKAAQNFNIHIATNGDKITVELADFFARNNISQIQYNFQGSRFHNSIHKKGDVSYSRLIESVKNTMKAGITSVAMITVGKYLIPYISEVFKEAADLNFNRIRVWETAGNNQNDWDGEKEIKSMFKLCAKEAKKAGFIHTLSYDPFVEADVNIHCPQIKNMFISVNPNCSVSACCVKQNRNNLIADLKKLPAKKFLNIYLEYNRKLVSEYCGKCFIRSIN
ncbi:radical SAM protein [Candidatus Dependentiae bacterium]|nr:radical SAM protein [Candidatus Dependentiae bacterium]